MRLSLLVIVICPNLLTTVTGTGCPTLRLNTSNDVSCKSNLYQPNIAVSPYKCIRTALTCTLAYASATSLNCFNEVVNYSFTNEDESNLNILSTTNSEISVCLSNRVDHCNAKVLSGSSVLTFIVTVRKEQEPAAGQISMFLKPGQLNCDCPSYRTLYQNQRKLCSGKQRASDNNKSSFNSIMLVVAGCVGFLLILSCILMFAFSTPKITQHNPCQ